jgi:ATP-binding protein involved in chromosome partitioning
MIKQLKLTPRIQKPQEPKIIVNLRRIKRGIMIISGKGGVGKITLATNLSIGLALHG